jgi:hypothetical protein
VEYLFARLCPLNWAGLQRSTETLLWKRKIQKIKEERFRLMIHVVISPTFITATFANLRVRPSPGSRESGGSMEMSKKISLVIAALAVTIPFILTQTTSGGQARGGGFCHITKSSDELTTIDKSPGARLTRRFMRSTRKPAANCIRVATLSRFPLLLRESPSQMGAVFRWRRRFLLRVWKVHEALGAETLTRQVSLL